MDPRELRASDAELRSVDPLARAKARMEAGEAEESAREAERVAQRREEHAARLAEQDMRDRIELHRQGFLDREVQAAHQQAEAVRQARIVELRAELDRLEGRSWRAPQADDVARWQDEMLARSAAGDREWSTGACMRARQASLQAEISRCRPRQPPVTATAGGRRVEHDVSPGPAPAIGARVARRATAQPHRADIPLSAPQFAHLLPRADY
jgi:hypothetical protein